MANTFNEITNLHCHLGKASDRDNDYTSRKCCMANWKTRQTIVIFPNPYKIQVMLTIALVRKRFCQEKSQLPLALLLTDCPLHLPGQVK